MVNRRPQLTLPIGDRRSANTAASPEEAAAVIAALERFMRDTAPARAPQRRPRDPWILAAMLEGVGREDEALTVWGEPHPWT
jgi:hypothetical protein